MLPNEEIVVLEIAGHRAVVACTKPSAEPALRALGFAAEGDALVHTLSDDASRIALIKDLIRLDAVFSEGRDWAPAELLGLYREQGVVTEPYRVIRWRNPSDYEIRRC
jgi:hypothetical protein